MGRIKLLLFAVILHFVILILVVAVAKLIIIHNSTVVTVRAKHACNNSLIIYLAAYCITNVI